MYYIFKIYNVENIDHLANAYSLRFYLVVVTDHIVENKPHAAPVAPVRHLVSCLISFEISMVIKNLVPTTKVTYKCKLTC
jgi:hypothetical protein